MDEILTIVVAIIPRVCTCGQFLGCRQKDYEDSLIEKQSIIGKSITVDQKRLIELEVCKEFYGMKMCCRNTFWNKRIPFIKDANKDSFVDEIGILNGYQNGPSKKRGIIFLPQREVPDFPDFYPKTPKKVKSKKSKD